LTRPTARRKLAGLYLRPAGIAAGVDFEPRYFPTEDTTFVAFTHRDNGAFEDLRKNVIRLVTGARQAGLTTASSALHRPDQSIHEAAGALFALARVVVAVQEHALFGQRQPRARALRLEHDRGE